MVCSFGIIFIMKSFFSLLLNHLVFGQFSLSVSLSIPYKKPRKILLVYPPWDR